MASYPFDTSQVRILLGDQVLELGEPGDFVTVEAPETVQCLHVQCSARYVPRQDGPLTLCPEHEAEATAAWQDRQLQRMAGVCDD